jgi:urease accessory protein
VNIRRDNKLIWYEQLKLAGGSQAMKNSLIMADKTVCGTFIAASERVLSSDLIDALRENANTVADSGIFGVSQVNSVIVARYLGDSSEVARNVMLKVWEVLRPELLGHKAVVPRMWNT